jgi:translation initiation factor 6 (eIF-6)
MDVKTGLTGVKLETTCSVMNDCVLLMSLKTTSCEIDLIQEIKRIMFLNRILYRKNSC